MLFNRHFFIICFSVFLIGVIFWWQKPVGAVSAMSGGEVRTNPYHTVKNYWKRLDYRQFDFAREMVAATAILEHQQLEKILQDNPLLSIQKVDINNTQDNSIFNVKITSGSVIDTQKEVLYQIGVGQSDQKFMITSIQEIP